MVDTASCAVYDLLGPKSYEVDKPIIDYIINVLSDEDFNFDIQGQTAYDLLGDLLTDSGCVRDASQGRTICQKLSVKLGKQGRVGEDKGSLYVRSLVAPVRMFDGMKEVEEASKKQLEVVDDDIPMFMSERDRIKLERRKWKEERLRKQEYQMNLAAMEAAKAGMPVVSVNHDKNVDGLAVRDICLENIGVSIGGRELIVDGEITLTFGRHYGLVGRNGTGKTTFLRQMAMHAIDGIPENCQILHVEQEIEGDDISALQCILNSDVERTQLLQEVTLLALQSEPELDNATEHNNGRVNEGIDNDQISQRLAEIYKRLEFIDADTAESRAASILAGLGFTPEMQQKSTKSFSGGWRMRLSLARALFIEPDLLLLDEPTNHLDLHAVLWLESYLLKWPKTFIVVSHAREFLNSVVTDILHLHGKKMVSYRGNYDNFLKTCEELRKNQQKKLESIEKEKEHMQKFIDTFRSNPKRASLVQSRIKALERMDHVDEIVKDPDYKFNFPTPGSRPGPPIIIFSDACFGYPGGPILFKNLNFRIDLDSRIAMVGSNGIGKSTILKLISGELQPTSGTVFRSTKVRIAIFSQHHVDGLDLTSNALLHMMRCFPGVAEQKLRAHLGSFGVTGSLALQPMYTLSGGQKSRVAFAKITFKKPHIILFDEPSNHLDLEAVEALIEGLVHFHGGVLMVSHDEHLISASVDELWAVSQGKIAHFPGDFKDYKKLLRIQ